MKNETTAELPSEWKGYAWSTDYQELYDLLKKGVRAVCLAPYARNEYPSIWDICYARFDATYGFDFGARGISYTRSYPSDDHSFEAFEKICKESDIVFLNPDSTSQIAALRSALEMVEKIEQCAKYCQVCGVHKGDNRGCFAHRGAKGHKWAFQAHIKETELLAFKKALAATPADPAKCSECGHVKHDGMLCRAAAGFDAICECFPSADPVREAATALVEQIDRQLTFNIPERFVLALKTALEAK